ncbi:nucleotide exchange factor GrpE [Treponema phagedenis]|uniref:nucleotide exchange factor GrpE n=1 Tax=Treponema phagedenis TaxID=162 RepID=UPI0001F63B98|nr:nucleotide exchange factor GrpE [Treponema phagedenis]EFW38519.1 co-chaperone GrpE [Treponema phagedenis F0421]TYT79468.1 nucleotide exchange factor GrpE [Treponema phagedenis]
MSKKEKKNEHTTKPAEARQPETAASAEAEKAAETSAEVPKTEANPLEAKVAELEAQNKELQDQYLRKAADFDNYRKRMIKEKQEAIDYANANLLNDILPILDNFDRAIEAGTKQSEGGSVAAFAEGVTMIRNEFSSMLESKYGLSYYPSLDCPFDPNLHEAVAMTPSKDVQEQKVGAELQKGYKLKDRILRHAKVMVFMPEEKEEAEAEKPAETTEKDTK